jgi:lipopolysaccharide transport system ATP-binding protein
MNGTILGMTRAEIKSKFDEIVEFAGVARYLDTPVKRYSSGMYVRLAFAVAAHLESEILIVDEVLAVGDAEFQKKCLGKMKDVSGQGRTVLFVSHNMSAVQNLCDKGLLVSNGKLEYINSIDVAINKFIKSNFSVKRSFDEYVKYYGDKVKITDIGIYQNNKATDLVNVNENSKLKISFEVKEDDLFCTPSIVLKDNLGNAILSTFHGNSSNILLDDAFESKLNKGNYVTELIFPPCFFNNKTYSIDFYFSKQLLDNHLEIKDFIIFDVVDNNERFLEYSGEWIGTIRPKFEWKTEVIS